MSDSAEKSVRVIANLAGDSLLTEGERRVLLNALGHGDCVPHNSLAKAVGAYQAEAQRAEDRDGEVMELRAERDRYREAIEQHRRAKTPKTLEAKRFYGLPSFADSALWDALPVDAEPERP